MNLFEAIVLLIYNENIITKHGLYNSNDQQVLLYKFFSKNIVKIKQF